MPNPNNCNTCKHKQNPDGGWCYMFRDEPTEVCMQHTGRQSSSLEDLQRIGRGLRDNRKNRWTILKTSV